ncbi:MAG: hypothetical protein MUF57_04435 [Gammaproteobacteria bacterium]|nr:hypothetical protein [Gammaproteobacteria bacterium]
MKPQPSTPADGSNPLENPPDFSLVLGGPLFQLLRRAHLSDDALLLVRQRIVVIALLAWLFCTIWRHTSAFWWWCPC